VPSYKKSSKKLFPRIECWDEKHQNPPPSPTASYDYDSASGWYPYHHLATQVNTSNKENPESNEEPEEVGV